VFVKRSELVSAIAQDQNTRAKSEEGASIAVISHSSKSLQAHNAIFMWFQLFIEVLLRMHHKSTDRRELIDICKKNYKGNKQEIMIIDEFEKKYKADNAIWWYTREACFYRMMNKALRVQDYDILFALRFFITDIAKQLKNEHEKFIRTSETREVLRVYRGQAIGKDELELMKNSVGEYLSMNSFLSTSRHRSTAIDFARLVSTEDGNEAIVFEIEINPRVNTKAFADVSKMSYYENEGEVLIMLGALFRIEKIVEDKKNRMWVAHVSLASEDDYHLKETFAYMKEKIGDDTSLDSLGNILIEMGEYRQAKKCYERMLEEFQLGVGDAQVGLGRARRECKEYEESLEHLEQALRTRRQILGDDHIKVGESYRHIGALYFQQSNYEEALVNSKEAIKILEKASIFESKNLAAAYHNIAITYHMMGENDLALQYHDKTLKVEQATLPADHPDIALTYNSLGCLYRDNDQFSKALEYYEKSLNISRKTLPPTHGDIIRTEKNIKSIKEKMNK
jgi:tetratricopeptide (TPR) repeat protein